MHCPINLFGIACSAYSSLNLSIGSIDLSSAAQASFLHMLVMNTDCNMQACSILNSDAININNAIIDIPSRLICSVDGNQNLAGIADMSANALMNYEGVLSLTGEVDLLGLIDGSFDTSNLMYGNIDLVSTARMENEACLLLIGYSDLQMLSDIQTELSRIVLGEVNLLAGVGQLTINGNKYKIGVIDIAAGSSLDIDSTNMTLAGFVDLNTGVLLTTETKVNIVGNVDMQGRLLVVARGTSDNLINKIIRFKKYIKTQHSQIVYVTRVWSK